MNSRFRAIMEEADRGAKVLLEQFQRDPYMQSRIECSCLVDGDGPKPWPCRCYVVRDSSR